MNKLFAVLLALSLNLLSAQGPNPNIPKPIKVTGIVLDQETGQPLEYATLILQSTDDPSKVTGGISNEKGKFNVSAEAGNYNIRVEFISYKTFHLNNQSLSKNTDLGTIKLSLDVAQLDGVELIAEKTTVELRLDKKIYNVGKDLTVRGGSVTDVLDNVPSVSVDVDGNISLRGNESVRILINGKPSALSGMSPETLKQLPADAIEKVEVITNPSARYDAEGTAGILNIVLRRSKTAGLNGSILGYAGTPESYGGGGSLNLRREKLNLFTNLSYRKNLRPSEGFYNSEYFDNNGATTGFQNEFRDSESDSESIYVNFGMEYFLSETSSITNSFVFGKSNGTSYSSIDFSNFDANNNPTINRTRNTLGDNSGKYVQYALNYEKRFNDDGHKLTTDFQYSRNNDDQDSNIEERVLGNAFNNPLERTITLGKNIEQLVQLDYVLPFGTDNKSQFEAGYRGNFKQINTDFDFGLEQNGSFTSDPNYSNELFYKENVNAAYMQLGTKMDKFSILGGLRMEASDIDVNLITTNDFNNKKYTNWFPSLFLGYEISEMEQFNISYSKRLRRPWSRFINPFPSRSSNTNLFYGNPDLDPTLTDAYDLGYLKRWGKATFNASIYYNHSTDVFEFISQENGDFVSIEDPNNTGTFIDVPVLARTPINLATEERVGVDLTGTYTPKRNWRLSLNLNLYQQNKKGDYTYTNFLDETITQNFDADNFTWQSRFSAKIPLPEKIDFQTTFFYRGPSRNAQSSYNSMYGLDFALSKDIFKDKATISVNAKNVLNSIKRRTETRTDNIFANSEHQYGQPSFTASLTYRFNQKKNHRNKNAIRENNSGGGEGEF